MTRYAMMIGLALMLVMAMSMTVSAENLDKNAACALLGNCSEDAIEMAKKMQGECQTMIEKAKVLMEKGKMIRGQGKIWDDKEMVAEGQALYDQGKTMMKHAEEMNNVCELIIKNAQKTKKKYKKALKGSDVDPNNWKTKTGDMH